ncbi:MAG: Crp/Fnr family transcriptional regulator, partial [Anaerolineae bacterium]|nr:Crp/Fnr family transcriptional regulator [Anaerolineae bacterium]
VGEFALLDGGARSARGQAQGPISVLVLERQVFMRFIQSRPQVVLAMLQYLADKARYTTQSVETSVAWMTQIAQGSYQAPQALATQPSAPAVATEPVAIALEPEALSEDTPALVNEVFSKAAASLHEREQAIRAGAAPQSP